MLGESTEESPDELQLAIQALDDGYFEEHPGDDYYTRKAFPGELEMAGYPAYGGLMLIYVLGEGVRLRKPVSSVDEAVAFVVEYEGSR